MGLNTQRTCSTRPEIGRHANSEAHHSVLSYRHAGNAILPVVNDATQEPDPIEPKLLRLHINGRPWRLTFADRFELDGTGALINTARVSKFGLPVGSVHQVIRKAPALTAGQAAD